MTVFSETEKGSLVPDPVFKGFIVAVTVVLTVTLSVPLSQAIVPVEGDYGRTVTVDYGNGVIIDAPASEHRAFRFGLPSSMHAFVDPGDPAVRQVASVLSTGKGGIADLDAVCDWIYDSIDYEFDTSLLIDDHWQMAGETLRKGTGDCEDMAILGASVMSALGYRAVLILEASHILFGAEVEPCLVYDTVRCNGHDYVTAEPTAGLIGVSCDPYLVTDSKWNGQTFLVLAILGVMEAIMLAIAVSLFRRNDRWERRLPPASIRGNTLIASSAGRRSWRRARCLRSEATSAAIGAMRPFSSRPPLIIQGGITNEVGLSNLLLQGRDHAGIQ